MSTSTPHESTLANWLADEARVLNVPRARGTLTHDDVRRLTGLQLFEAMLRGELPGAPIGETLNFVLIEVSPGHTIFQGQPTAKLHNPMGGIHGGWYATLLDSCMACAVHTTLPQGRAYTTTEFNVHLVRAIPPQLERVRAVGQVLHQGKQLATAEGKLIGPDGRLYAHSTSSCLIFDLPGAKTS